MSKQSKSSKEMVSTKSKNKVVSCSTPEHRQVDSPTRDSDSEAASPVPFYCTQDGAEGETDVVWNFYTPKSNHNIKSHHKSTTPLSRRSKKSIRPRLIEKQPPKRRPLKISQKNSELFQDLIELNQNLQDLIAKKPQNNCILEKQQSGSEDDVFSESPEYSSKNALRNSSNSLRKNVLSSCFGKPDIDTALESDDSMNECLIKASQIVEENILNCEPSAKRTHYESSNRNDVRTEINCKMDNDSMDYILNSIKLESPAVIRAKKCYSPCSNNDSFDSLVGNLNDSALEQLTQMPVKINMANQNKTAGGDWTIKELVVHDGSPTKSLFGRHYSMPESPSVTNVNKPSTSGMVFGRYSSMPFENNANKSTAPGDSPIRCTPEEIKKKHRLAREKLMAKRLFPYTSSETSQYSDQPTQVPQPPIASKKPQFQPKLASSTMYIKTNHIPVNAINAPQKTNTNSVDLRLLIEKKRQEALMKLRRRQPQSKNL